MHRDLIVPGRLRAFDGREREADARAAGWFFAAALLNQPNARAWCERMSIPIMRAQGEAVGASGAVLVPETVVDEILSLRDQAGVFAQYADQRTMSSDAMVLPRRTSGWTVAFTAEGKAPAESQAAFDGVELIARKIGAFGKISNELNEDAIASFGRWITQELAWAFADKEDTCGFNGDGTSTYGGIRGLTQLFLDGNHTAGKVTCASHSTFSTLDGGDLGALVAACPEYALPGAAWFCSSYAIGQTFVRLGATACGVIATPAGPRPMLQYQGWPIVPTPKLPGSGSQSGKVMVCFGDLSLSSTLGGLREVTVRLSGHRFMDTDQLGMLGTERFDIVNRDLGDNSKAGAIVALAGA
jgi:HK97 family phage major capsid protein